jgi:glycosyltransferase involved in cell wall biosynthesis
VRLPPRPTDTCGPNRVLVVGWVEFHTRNEGLAAELGGATAYHVWGPRGNPAVAVVRYAVQFALTLRDLMRRRPRRIVAMVPPFPALAACLLYSVVARAQLVGDVHTYPLVSSTWRPFLGVTAWLLRRGQGAVVTNAANAEVLTSRGVSTIVLDDTPRTWPGREQPPGPSPVVVVPASFDPDEPIEAIVAAARQAPDVEVVITGRDETGRTRDLDLPANLHLAGYLPRADYERLLAGAAVVTSLTTLDDCMQQAGYEAMAWGRPLVTSDWAELRDYFGPAAVYVRPRADDIAAGWRRAIAQADELHRHMLELGDRKVAGRSAEIATLRDLLGLPAQPGPQSVA